MKCIICNEDKDGGWGDGRCNVCEAIGFEVYGFGENAEFARGRDIPLKTQRDAILQRRAIRINDPDIINLRRP